MKINKMETYEMMDKDKDDEKSKIKLLLLCRTCLKRLKTPPKYNIFTMSHLSKLLSIFTSLEIIEKNDVLPKYLCDKCFEKIEDFYNFRIMCIDSMKKFYQIYDNIKNDDDDDHYHNIKDNRNMKILEIIIKSFDQEQIAVLNEYNNHDDEQQQQQINEYEKKNNEQKLQNNEISCSKIEEEVVNVLANMVQIPNSPRQLTQTQQIQEQQYHQNIQQQQHQQQLKNNYQVQETQQNDNNIESDENILLEEQLETLCKDQFIIVEECFNESINESMNKLNNDEDEKIEIMMNNDDKNTADDSNYNDHDDDDVDDNIENDENDNENCNNYDYIDFKNENICEINKDVINNEENFKEYGNVNNEDNNIKKNKIKRKKNKMKTCLKKQINTRSKKCNNYENDYSNNCSRTNGVNNNNNSSKRTNQEVFICKICDKRYFKKEKFEACMRSHKGLKPWVCPECKKEYRKKASLMNHIKYEHKKNCEMYSCPVEGCDKSYRLKQTMQVHYRRIHVKDLLIKDQKINNKSYICEQCGKSLRTLNALNQHRFIHTGDFPYKCEQCPKRCGTRYQLEVHMKRHKGIKNYICSICGLKKITQQELNTHMNYHSRDKIFRCKFCPYTSCNNGNVVRHEKIVHHGIKTFECQYCGKTFGKAETLKHHVMTHTGEKPHGCHICGRRFIQSTALKTHLKRHDKGIKSSSSSSSSTSLSLSKITSFGSEKKLTKNLNLNNIETLIKNEKIDQYIKIEGTTMNTNNEVICNVPVNTMETMKLFQNSNNMILDDETPPDIIQTVEIITTTTTTAIT